ncbi:MAG: HAD-IA family hydrolase [Bacteroidales bacterium]|mgnify:CR=1 FL=1|nr:HAD-IA family hydrolase [Bacteroidales bacterium]
MNDLKDIIRLIIFDWGDTLMRDYPGKAGPMYVWDHVECIEGVPELLAYLHGRYTLCVATNAGVSDTEAMRKALRRVNIEHYFSGFFSSKDLGVAKPDPRFFLNICAEMNVEPQHSLMIGNDYEKDICGAFQAGLFTVLFREKGIGSDFEDGDFSKAHKVIYSLLELKKLL